MFTAVIFLDGELEGQMLFGIPDNREYKWILSMEDTNAYHWCGEEECCEPPHEPFTQTYYVTSLGDNVRVATLEAKDKDNRDKLAFRLAEVTYHLWSTHQLSQHPRWNKSKESQTRE